MTRFLVVEKMPCPKCKGTGTLQMARSLDSMWDELIEYLTEDGAQRLSQYIKSSSHGRKPTTELLMLANMLEAKFP